MEIRNTIIEDLIKKLEEQKRIAVDGIHSPTTTDEQLHYVKQGMQIAFALCIETLEDEL